MVQASRSLGPRSKNGPRPSADVVLHGSLERFVTTSGKDDLGRRVVIVRWCGGPSRRFGAAGSMYL